MLRNDLTENEYESMKDDTLEQIKEFTATLDRLNKGDVTVNSKISSMRTVCIYDNYQSSMIHFIIKVYFPFLFRKFVKRLPVHSTLSK